MSAFSKVNLADLDDDEDEDDRKRIGQRAIAKYEQAQDVYNKGGSQEDALKLFSDADRLFHPLLGNGFASMQPKELEVLLKCRLHQAAITAMLDHLPNRWPNVQRWCIDVLQFDAANCHAHWLLAFALQNGDMDVKPGEVDGHMQQAMQFARATGKSGEADRWQAEYERYKTEGGGFRGDARRVEFSASDGTATKEQSLVDDGAKGRDAPKTSGQVAKDVDASKKSLQKGFLNKGKPVAVAKTAAKDGIQGAATAAAPSPPPAPEAPGAALAEEQRRQLADQRKAVEELQRQVGEYRRRELDVQDEAQQSRALLRERLWTVTTEVVQQLTAERDALSRDDRSGRLSALQRELSELRVSLQRAQTTAAEARSVQSSARDWSESQHQRFLDVSTEILTLKEMYVRECRERQEASRQQVSDVRELSRRFGELKGQVKSLRDHFRLKASGSTRDDKEERDPQQLAEHIADFRRLPLGAKLSALLDDAAVLKLGALAFLLGALLVLALFVEGFGRGRCVFVCSRQN